MFMEQDSTAYGISCQPHSVDIFDYGICMFKKDVKTILWENVQALMLAEFKKESLGQFAKKCGIGAASMTRIKRRDTGVMITTIESIARAYGVQPWELLVDGLGKKVIEWPFSTVTQAQFTELDVVDKAAIEGYIEARIGMARDKPNIKNTG